MLERKYLIGLCLLAAHLRKKLVFLHVGAQKAERRETGFDFRVGIGNEDFESR